MGIPESLVVFAGLVFAHAAWNVSDLPKDELLVPIVMIEKSGKRELMRFEGETQVQAITEAKKWIAAHEKSFDSWVFAREGQFKENGVYVDALTVEAKTKGMKESVIFVQRFQPFYKGKFKLIGEPIINSGEKELDAAQAKLLRTQLIKGVQTHPKASTFWAEWTKP